MARIMTHAAAMLTAMSSVAAAQDSIEHRLSPEEIQKVLDESARKREGKGPPVAAESAPESSRTPIHGEVGFAIGTGGYRAAYGTAVVGLSDDHVAIVSFGTRKLPDEHYFYPGW